MATQAAPATEQGDDVRGKRPGPPQTTVRVLPDTKRLLDALLASGEADTFDELIREMAIERAQPGLGFELSPRETIGTRVARIEETLREIEADLLVTDPKTGALFNPVRGREVTRNVRGKLPVHGQEGKFFPLESEAGVHLSMHDETEPYWLCERDGELPPAVVEHVKMLHAKEEKRTPVYPRGRFFREPDAPAAAPPAAAPPAEKGDTGKAEKKKAPAKE